MNQKIIDTIMLFSVGGLAGIIIAVLIGQSINGAIIRHEQNECRAWQQQAIDFADAGFYLTSWQEAQCEAVGLPVQVKEPTPRKDFNL